jgi:hypothetical protein
MKIASPRGTAIGKQITGPRDAPVLGSDLDGVRNKIRKVVVSEQRDAME